MSSARDSTEHVAEHTEAGEAVNQLMRRNELILDSAGEGIYGLDREGRTTFVNPAAAILTGFDPEDLIGEHQHRIIHHSRPDGTPYPEEECPICAVLRDGEVRHVDDEVFWRKDGTSFPVEYTGTPIREDGEVTGAVVTFSDITERKEAHERLAESERRFSAVVSNAHAYAYRCLNEPGYPHEFASDYVLELTGYPPEDLLVGGEIRFGDLIIEEDRSGVWEEIQEALAGHKPFEVRYALRRKDGEIRHVREHGQGVYDQDGDVVALEGLVYDLTELVEAEERLRESEERFRALTQNSSDIVTLLGAKGTIRYQSPSIERILGYRPEEMVGDNAFDYVHPEDLGGVERAFTEGLKDPRRRPSAEYRFRHKDGSWRWLESTGTNLLDDPQVGEYVVNSRDVTERKWAEMALKESEQRFRSSFEDAAIGVALVATDGRWLRVNPSLCEIVGYAEEELLGKTCQDITHPDDLDADLGQVRRILAGEIDTYQIEKRYLHKEGHVVWILLGVSLVHDEEGEPLYFIAQILDINERKRIEEQLQHQALHDLLTDLPNRHLFVDRLKQALVRTRRKQGIQVAVLFMDLDNFKAINDSLGHEAGDLLLVVVAERLRRCLRPEDTLARFGGDEFVVLIEDVESPEDAVRVAERIVEGLREPFIVEGRELFLRASIGVALGTARQKSPEDLLRDADTAMYEAKEAGLGYRVFDPAMYERVVGRLEKENKLRRAIEADEFVVHYQPIMSPKTGEMWGVEALVRWSHPERGLLDPWEFMAVAEQSGIVVPMGEQVLEAACRQAEEWQVEHPRIPPLVMSVNLSARQLQRPDISQIVERVLKKTGLEARCLRLDITETVYIKALEGNTAALDELRRIGVCISIDDFGTGYSSLAYLKRLPANALKIDRSFVKGIGEDIKDTAIAGMVIELAHTLGMEAIAEGVESEAQATLLKEMGCDLAQGFYFSEPLPPETATRFLAEERTS